jgi:hypothetical protein
LYEILVGHDRFVADIRSRLYPVLERTLGTRPGHVCHPYDACTILIGLESGVIITDPWGNPLNSPLNTTEDLGMIVYANQAIYDEVWPHLSRIMVEEGL